MTWAMIAACGIACGLLVGDEGAIGGVVLNASQSDQPAGDTQVVLRAQRDGVFLPVAQVLTDNRGRFLFEGLPADGTFLFQPGASRDGVFYPGPRVVLESHRANVRVELRVHDAVASPSPLVATRHEIRFRPETGMLHITETMLISNPTQSTYVGAPRREGGRPVTLQVHIPKDFIKVTFHKEFFGKHFHLVNERLLTDVPWPPGDRELAFHYVLPNEQRHRVFRRPLDMPCSNVRVRIAGTERDAVQCSLTVNRASSANEVCFSSDGATLPAGHEIRVELGRLPVSTLAQARWFALALLVLLITATGVVIRLRGRNLLKSAAESTTTRTPKQATLARQSKQGRSVRLKTSRL